MRDGDLVAEGAVLARLDGRRPRADLALAEAALEDLLLRQARALAERRGDAAAPDFAGLPTARAAVEDALFKTRVADRARQGALLDARAAALTAERVALHSEAAATEQALALVRAEIETQRDLQARGLSEAPRLSALAREAARLQGALAALQADQAARAGLAAEITLQRLRLGAEAREAAEAELERIARALPEARQRRDALRDRVAGLAIRAPVAGRVHGLQIAGPGVVLPPARPLLTLVPQDRARLVTVRLRPADIARVRIGQPVRLRLPGPPDPARPGLTGHLTRLSAESLTDEQSRQSFFTGEVALDAPSPGLTPGQPVEVMITAAPRRAAALLLDPLTRYFTRALRSD